MGKANSFGSAVLVPLSTRIPVWQFNQIDAMAAKASKSRNAMVAIVLGVGIDEIRSHLDDETTRELQLLEGKASLSAPAGEGGECF